MYLALDGNPLDELPYLPESLRVLNASSCQLVEVVELPRKLEYLTLNYNYLTSLPTLPDHLDTLEIHCNDIQELPFLPLSLRRLVIGDNPALKKYIGKSIAEIRHIICMRLAGERTYRIKGELTAALDKKLTKAQATESE
jgi:Leucine-rich repeat (LRR) protein